MAGFNLSFIRNLYSAELPVLYYFCHSGGLDLNDLFLSPQLSPDPRILGAGPCQDKR